MALPLTLFTGTSQLTTVIHDGAALGAGLVIAVVFLKMLVFALCEATGFIGGPFLVMLFIGGTADLAVAGSGALMALARKGQKPAPSVSQTAGQP